MGKWTARASAVAEETRQALRTVFDALNQGQQQKLMKEKAVKSLFDRYGVEAAEAEDVGY